MKKLFLIVILIIGLSTVLFNDYQRINLESSNKSVQFILDYDEIEKLAKQSEKDTRWWLESFRDLGVTSVAIVEESIHSLIKDDKDLKIEVFKNIKSDPNWRDKYSKEFINLIKEDVLSDYDIVMTTRSKDILEFVTIGLKNRYGADSYRVLKENNYYTVVINGEENEALYLSSKSVVDSKGKYIMSEKELFSSKVATMGLGFDNEKIDIIKESGLEVIPRPFNYKKYSKELVKAFISEVESKNLNPNTIIFAGKDILGSKEGLGDLANFMNSNNISLSLIESGVQRQHIKQDGMEELTSLTNYNVLRTFTMWDWLRQRYKYYSYEGAEEIENSLYRAITERNIRAIYFKPFMKNGTDYVTDYNEYKRTFDSLENRLNKHGIKIGLPSKIEYFKVSNLSLLLMGLGLVGGSVLLLSLIFNTSNKINIPLTILGAIFVMGILYLNRGLTQKVLALGSSIVFPSLGILYFVRTYRKIILSKKDDLNIKVVFTKAIITLIVTSLISIVGGLFIGAILADVDYLLEMDIFRGVKISQLLPLAVFLLIYIVEFGYDRENKSIKALTRYKNDIIKLFDTKIKIKHIIFTSVILGIGYVYISRTGHETSVQPSDLEMMVRNILENVLLARPRTKEFLISFPILMGGIYLAYRGYKKPLFIFALGSVIGQTSIANTFSHIRTPLYLSIVRTLYSIGFGVILGLLFIITLKILDYFLLLIKGARTNE